MELIHSSIIIVTSKEIFFVQPKQLNVRAKLNMSGHTDQPILNFIFSSALYVHLYHTVFGSTPLVNGDLKVEQKNRGECTDFYKVIQSCA